MSHCAGTPAEQWAEEYVAGTLPAPEADAFEEHYFDCPICFAQVRALQVAATQIARSPVKASARLIRFPEKAGARRAIGAIGAIAALLPIAIVITHGRAHRADVAMNRGRAPAQAQGIPAMPPASSADAQLADLTLPPFQASSLRGEGQDADFRAGMNAYESGDCATAVDRLVHVPARSPDAPAARLYSGVCQMKLHRLAEAASTLAQAAGKSDSPLQEAALYYLAQTNLLLGDSAGARRNLKKTISLHGEFEQRARSEQSRLRADTTTN